MGKLQEKLELKKKITRNNQLKLSDDPLTVLAIAGNTDEERIYLIEEQLETITTPEQILAVLKSVYMAAFDLKEKGEVCVEAISEAMDKIEKAGVEIEW